VAEKFRLYGLLVLRASVVSSVFNASSLSNSQGGQLRPPVCDIAMASLWFCTRAIAAWIAGKACLVVTSGAWLGQQALSIFQIMVLKIILAGLA
jgi:hypothetical protein